MTEAPDVKIISDADLEEAIKHNAYMAALKARAYVLALSTTNNSMADNEKIQALASDLRAFFVERGRPIDHVILSMLSLLAAIASARFEQKDLDNDTDLSEEAKEQAMREMTDFSLYQEETRVRCMSMTMILEGLVRMNVGTQPDAPEKLKQAVKNTLDKALGRDPSQPLS